MNRRKFFKTTAIAVAGIITPISVILSKPKNKSFPKWRRKQYVDPEKPVFTECDEIGHYFEYVNPHFLIHSKYATGPYFICKKCNYLFNDCNDKVIPTCIEMENTNDLISGMNISYGNNQESGTILYIRDNKVWLLPPFERTIFYE